MKSNVSRCVSSSALIVVLLLGCSSHPPAEITSARLEPRPVPTDPGPTRRTDSGQTRRTDPGPTRRSEQRASRSVTRESLPVLDESATVDDYVRYASRTNAGLKAAYLRWRATVERVPQVRSLPDPRITYGYFLAEVETRVGSQEQQVGMSQTFPWFGKLKDREDAARKGARVEYWRFEAARRDLRFRVETAYNELFFLERSIDIASENLALLKQFERIARARYRVAAASHPDIIRIQVELGKLEDDIRRLEDLRAPNTARLNALLNRPEGAEVSWPSSVREQVTDSTIDELLAVLRLENPSLKALAEATHKERIQADVAKKDGLPDFTVGLTYTDVEGRDDASVRGNGDDAFLASLSINLPIWRGRYDAGVREARARRMAVSQDRIETVNRLTSDLRQALFDHHDARRRVDLYGETLIPKATESLRASLAGFEQGKTDFLDLLDTERTLLEFQLEVERAAVDRATSYSRIEMLVGTVLQPAPVASEPKEDDR